VLDSRNRAPDVSAQLQSLNLLSTVPFQPLNTMTSLADLPASLAATHILARLAPDDVAAVRGSCRAGRAAANTAARRLLLTAPDLLFVSLERLRDSFPGLTKLELRDTPGCAVTGPLLSAFCGAPAEPPQLPRLQGLDLSLAFHIPPVALRELLAACPALTSLVASRWADAAWFAALAPVAASLRELHVGDETNDVLSLTNSALVALPQLPALETLQLIRCTGVSDAGLSALPAKVPRLTQLSLARCATLVGYGLASLPPSLRRLDLSGCQSLTEHAFEAFCASQAAAGLQSLALSSTQLPAGSLADVARLSALTQLDLGPAWELDGLGVDALGW
jgi:hypothetical protein